MASIHQLKSRFQALLRPMCDALVRMGATPNQVTLLAIALSFATGGLIALYPGRKWPLLMVPVMLLVRYTYY